MNYLKIINPPESCFSNHHSKAEIMNQKLLQKSVACIGLSLITAGYAEAQPFVNALPVPPTISGPVINIEVDSAMHNFNPGMPGDTFNVAIKSYCYNQTGQSTVSYLGPTQIWTTGQTTTINVTNNLNTSTTTHWHGANLPADDDGGPHEIIPGSGGTFNPNFTIMEGPTTLWYHSHLMDHTTTQVAMGLAGIIIVQDPMNDPLYPQLPHNYGVNDFPVVIQEKGFVIDTANMIATGIDTGTGMPAHPTNQFYTTVNGIMHGYLHVPQQVVRFRVLNGSIRKSFQFGMSPTLVNPSSGSFADMTLIAMDGGYTDQPYTLDSVLFMPGERRELLLDFSAFANGDTVYLSNLERSIPAEIITHSGNGNPNQQQPTTADAFCAFVVDNTIVPANPVFSVPTWTAPPPPDTSNVFQHRTKRLYGGAGTGGAWLIDSIPMDMNTINDVILVDSKEIWSIINKTNVAHPFHIHKVEFRVLDITDTVTMTNVPLTPDMMGPKDVVMVMPNWKLRFVATFDSFPAMYDPMNGFMYHCHILTHEDSSMMHQFVVVDSMTYNSVITGTNPSAVTDPFTLYPNPANDIIFMKGNSSAPGRLRFMDALGRVVREEKLAAFNDVVGFKVGDLPRGVLFVEWTSGNERFTKKVLLK